MNGKTDLTYLVRAFYSWALDDMTPFQPIVFVLTLLGSLTLAFYMTAALLSSLTSALVCVGFYLLGATNFVSELWKRFAAVVRKIVEDAAEKAKAEETKG